MMPSVVETENLKKFFVVDRPLHEQCLSPFASRKTVCALDGVSFSIESGEILGVVGPNGAGKTTLLRILANLLEADGGRVKLCGQELNSHYHLRGHIGYVSSDERSFFWRLTGAQNLEFFANLYGVRRQKARKRIAELLGTFALEEKTDQRFGDYSTGTRKKFALVRALVHRPKILLLDEVTNSLDASSARSAKSLVRDYVSAEDGRVAVWSTHRFEELGEICDKVLTISKGHVKLLDAVRRPEKDNNERIGSPTQEAVKKVKPALSVNAIVAGDQ
jgi:ABC-2 type transport system ATP-binding protein